MKRFFLLSILFFVYSTSFAQPVATENTTHNELNGAISVLKPDIFYSKDSKLTGFGYDLWDAICKELGYKCLYKDIGEFKNTFEAIENGSADFGIASITKTEDREKIYDFSDTYLESDLAIALVGDSSIYGIAKSYVSALFSFKVLLLFFVPLIFSRVMGVAIYFIEKQYPDIPNTFVSKDPQNSGWDVATRSFWESMTTQGTGVAVPRTRTGYFLCYVVGYYAGIIINALFISAFVGIVISVAWTAHSSKINSINDLTDRKVATARNTTSEEALIANGAKLVLKDSIEEAYQDLLDGKVEAVVFDKISVLYFAQNEGKDKVVVVDGGGYKERYGFIFPQGSPLRDKANQILLRFIKDGTYDEIYNKWFNQSQ